MDGLTAAEQPLGVGLVGVGLVGAGRIGSFHAETLARRVPGARLVAVDDAAPGVAKRVTGSHGGVAYDDPRALLEDIHEVEQT